MSDTQHEEWMCPRCSLIGDHMRTNDPGRCKACCCQDAAPAMLEALKSMANAQDVVAKILDEQLVCRLEGRRPNWVKVVSAFEEEFLNPVGEALAAIAKAKGRA